MDIAAAQVLFSKALHLLEREREMPKLTAQQEHVPQGHKLCYMDLQNFDVVTFRKYEANNGTLITKYLAPPTPRPQSQFRIFMFLHICNTVKFAGFKNLTLEYSKIILLAK